MNRIGRIGRLDFSGFDGFSSFATLPFTAGLEAATIAAGLTGATIFAAGATGFAAGFTSFAATSGFFSTIAGVFELFAGADFTDFTITTGFLTAGFLAIGFFGIGLDLVLAVALLGKPPFFTLATTLAGFDFAADLPGLPALAFTGARFAALATEISCSFPTPIRLNKRRT